jgi:hypothetical protein
MKPEKDIKTDGIEKDLAIVLVLLSLLFFILWNATII